MNIKSTEELLTELLSQDTKKQAHALVEIEKRQLSELTKEVVTLLDSSDPVIRGNAVSTLGFIAKHHTHLVGPKLIELLADPENFVRTQAVEALGRLLYLPAVLPLMQKLSDQNEDPLLRLCAAESLGYLGDPQAISALLPLFDTEGEDELTCCYAAFSLGLIGSPAWIPTLQKLIQQESSPLVLINLYLACIRLGHHQSIQQLKVFLQQTPFDEDAIYSAVAELEFLLDYKPSAFVQSQQAQLRLLLTELQQRYASLVKERDLTKKQTEA